MQGGQPTKSDAISVAVGTPGSVVQRMMEAQAAQAMKQEQMMQQNDDAVAGRDEEERAEDAAGTRDGPARAGVQDAREPDGLRGGGGCGRKEELQLRHAMNDIVWCSAVRMVQCVDVHGRE